MLYSLVLILFMGDGSKHEFTLSKKLTDDTCIDQRDYVRMQTDYLNDLDFSVKGGVEFVDAECVANKSFY